MLNKIVLAAKGFCMGAADVVPGVSGGTMAFILGIYSQLLQAIRSFDKTWLQHILHLRWSSICQHPHFGFLIPLMIGIIAAILFFTRIVPLPTLIHTHPEPIYGLFFGLILGSILSLLFTVHPLRTLDGLYLGVGIALGWSIVNLMPVETPDASWFIFLSGMLAISAMLLPGISGSFILLILKKYELILSGIGHFHLMVIIPFGLGAVTGLIIFSRALTWLLNHFYRQTLFTIIGILIGTLWIIWPFQIRHYVMIKDKEKLLHTTPYMPDALSQEVIYAIFMIIIGFKIIMWLSNLQRIHQRKTVA